MQNENEEDKVNEPQAGYGNRVTITTLSDLEEQDREHTRNMTHEQRLAYLQKLIRITHGDDLSQMEKKFYENKIEIRKPE